MLTQKRKIIRSCRSALRKLFRNDLRTYIKLFFWENEVNAQKNKDVFEVLQKAGLLTKNNENYRANVMVYPLKDKFIITDFVFSVRRKKIISSDKG